MPRIITVAGNTPDVSRAAFVAPDAVIAGDVVLGEGASVWYGCVIRAEYAPVRIGARSNIQDLTVIHTDPGIACTIGEDVTVGHRAVVHGATVGDNTLVGMGSVLLNNCRIGHGSIVGGAALVREGFEVPPNHLAVGVPAKLRPMPAPPEQVWPNVAAYAHLSELYAEADPADPVD